MTDVSTDQIIAEIESAMEQLPPFERQKAETRLSTVMETYSNLHVDLQGFADSDRRALTCLVAREMAVVLFKYQNILDYVVCSDRLRKAPTVEEKEDVLPEYDKREQRSIERLCQAFGNDAETANVAWQRNVLCFNSF